MKFLLPLLLVVLFACSGPQKPAARFVPPSDEVLAARLEDAPPPPAVHPDLNLQLVDYIDCTDPDDPHPFKHDGHTRVVTTAVGTYRETGAPAGSFFGYRFKVGPLLTPYVVIIEYPDDKERTISFIIQEAEAVAPRNGEGTVESGIYTGGDYPLSQAFHHHSLLLWPSAAWPSLVCFNQQPGTPAAASRIWVCRLLTGLPPADITEPDSVNRRKIGFYYPEPPVAGPPAGPGHWPDWDNVMEYLAFTGCNLLAVNAVAQYKPLCKTHYFTGPEDHIEKILGLGDQHRVDCMVVFDPAPECRVGELTTGQLTGSQVIDQWIRAMDDFVRRYRPHPSLTGISFGGPAAGNRFTGRHFKDLQLGLYHRLQAQPVPVTQYVFFGYDYHPRHYFTQPGYTPYDLIAAWEQNRKTFRETLAGAILRYWKERQLDPLSYLWKKDLALVRTYYPTDHCRGRYSSGFHTPRYQVHREYGRASQVAQLTAGNFGMYGACSFNPGFKHVLNLNPEKGESWWPVTSVAPVLNPAHKYFQENVVIPLAHDDVSLFLLAGGTNPVAGFEKPFKDFATAFRSLPAKKFNTISREGDPVVTRLLRRYGYCYFYFLNTTGEKVDVSAQFRGLTNITFWVSQNPFHIKWNVLRLTLEPFELAVFHANAGLVLKRIQSIFPPALKDRIRDRIDSYAASLDTARACGLELSPKYRSLLASAKAHYKKRNYLLAREALGETVPAEVEFRLDHRCHRPSWPAARCPSPPVLDGQLNEWPPDHTLWINTGTHLTASDLHPNHWSGPADFSAQVRAAYDRHQLYLAITTCDDKIMEGDRLALYFSVTDLWTLRDNGAYDAVVFLPYAGREVKDTVMAGGVRFCSRPTDQGHDLEVKIPFPLISASPGTLSQVGLTIACCDMDHPELIAPAVAEACDNLLVWPPGSRFDYRQDPRAAGIINLQK